MQDNVAVQMSKSKKYIYKNINLCISGNAKKKTVPYLFL